MRSLLLLPATAALVMGCAHPTLVVDPATSVATIEFVNSSSGYTQQYFFGEPASCKQPSIIVPLEPRHAKSIQIPANRPITIWTSAWGLPADPGMVAWCRPSAFTTRLVEGRTYQARFMVDAAQRKCGVLLTSSDDPHVRQIARRVDGPEIAGGPLTKAFACDPSDDLSSLSK